ncbi:MAG TPA: NAD(P)-dependent oxidoreductase [Anaerolineales bacterium]|nr:NAD(P)-dependent oxidoreductase [Anaerolineales bacterium]
MQILLTGAFGNLGVSTLEELLNRGHQVRAFDIMTRTNLHSARRYQDRLEVCWGDLRDPASLFAAVQDQQAVIHLGYVIPRLSATGVNSEDRPEWAREINVGGTRNLLDAMLAQPEPPRLIFGSSLHVFGRTQADLPPRRVSDPLQPVEHYAQHKVETERMIRNSRLVWSIFRFGAALPIRLILDPGMFEVPLDNRIEFVHSRDVALAIANALEGADVWGKTLLIGGGKPCQLTYREMMESVLGVAGLGKFPDQAFTSVPYSTDWLDTAESQRLLNYQTRTLADYLKEMKARLSYRRGLVLILRPFIRRWLLRRSPYYGIRRPVPGAESLLADKP